MEWLGEIPEHWHLKRIKYLAPLSDERFYEADNDLPYIGFENVESWTGRLRSLETNEYMAISPESSSSMFRAGDVLFGKLRPYLAKVLKASFDGICSNEFFVLRPYDFNPKFLSYYLLNPQLIQFVDFLTYGTRMPRISRSDIAILPVNLPPNPEQRAIAAFLDRETAKIDALLAKKERLIELLQEKRRAL